MTIKKKEFYSTSEIAKLCHVHRNTVILAIRKGDLKASTTPGGHNRINHEEFVRFARERGLPVLAFPGEDDSTDGREQEKTPSKRRVLVVDDDEIIDKLVRKALTLDRYEIETARSGYDAGFKTSAFRPDLILLDIMLGDIDGAGVYKMLKENEFTRSIRILVITAIQDDGKIRSFFPEEVPYLKKPFGLEELSSRVEEIFSLERTEA